MMFWSSGFWFIFPPLFFPLEESKRRCRSPGGERLVSAPLRRGCPCGWSHCRPRSRERTDRTNEFFVFRWCLDDFMMMTKLWMNVGLFWWCVMMFDDACCLMMSGWLLPYFHDASWFSRIFVQFHQCVFVSFWCCLMILDLFWMLILLFLERFLWSINPFCGMDLPQSRNVTWHMMINRGIFLGLGFAILKPHHTAWGCGRITAW